MWYIPLFTLLLLHTTGRRVALCIHGNAPIQSDLIQHIYSPLALSEKVTTFRHQFVSEALPIARDQSKPLREEHPVVSKSIVTSYPEFVRNLLAAPLFSVLSSQFQDLPSEAVLSVYGKHYALEKLWKHAMGYAAMEQSPFDVFVVVSTDYNYRRDIKMPLHMNESQLYVTGTSSGQGFNADIAFGGVDGMRVYCNRQDYELPCEDWLKDKETVEGVPWNAERFVERKVRVDGQSIALSETLQEFIGIE